MIPLTRSSQIMRSSVSSRTSVGVQVLRTLSSKPSDASSELNPNAIFIISIPITTKKSYVYCNHKPSILSATQTSKYPVVTKIENRLIGVATKIWHKISTSKQSVNIKITNMAKKILDTIPYEENCLRSFPSKNSMIREINESDSNNELHNEHKDSKFIQNYLSELKVPSHQIKPVLLYHPEFQSESVVLSQLDELRKSSYAKHYRNAILCGVGVPISLPFALLPVIPNIPGFYLAYRFYCNLKALGGISNLKYLLNDQDVDGAESKDHNSHLKFKGLKEMDSSYKLDNHPDELSLGSVQEEERVILSPKIIEDLTHKLALPQLAEELKKALRQENSRLKKNIKVDDAVQ